MKTLLSLFALCLPLVASGGWVDANGKPIPDSEHMRSAGDFAVQIVLTADDKTFRRTWNATTGTPTLATTDTVRVGSSISAMIIFHGCAPNAAGVCDVVVDFALESPDGKHLPGGGGQASSAAPLKAGMLQLGQANMTVGFDKSDPPGEYRIVANVKDKVSGRALSVVGRFKLTR